MEKEIIIAESMAINVTDAVLMIPLLTVKGLEEKINNLNDDLKSKQRELADVSKPEMTDVMFDQITELVEESVESVRIEEDDLEYSMEIDYDNKVCLSDISLQNSDRFAEKIMCAIDSHYKLTETEDKE